MSEFMNACGNRSKNHGQLLATVSVMALIGSVCGVQNALADGETSTPQVWIELGGQLSRLDDSQEIFAPPFLAGRPSIFEPSQKFERPPLYGFDEDGKLSFQPENADWIFSASIRYGRSASSRKVHQQTYPGSYFKYTASGGIGARAQPAAAKFADTNARTSENHLLLDFQAGKDVGLGMFGANSSSVVSLGVRIAQFAANSNTILKSDPDWHFYHKYVAPLHKSLVIGQAYHSNYAREDAARSFRGVGPSISWNASTPFAGNVNGGEITFDWGANASLLFGRQKAKTHHQTTARYHGHKYAALYRAILYQHPATPDHTRNRSVTVPNVGGFAGLSFRYADAKVSFGYRADFFFNAIDGGIDARKSENRGFYGPFASISVGLGN